MSKRGFLSDQEKEFIDRHNGTLSVEEIAKSLDRTEKQVEGYVESLGQTQKERTPVEKLMGRRERNGQVEVTVMTGAASELIDDIAKRKRGLPSTLKSSVHRPKG